MSFKEKMKPLDELFGYFFIFTPIIIGIVVSLGMDERLLWFPLIMFLLWTLYIYAYRAKYHIASRNSFHGEMPFGKKKYFIKKIREANLEKIKHLIKICGFLLQTKVYLFWKRSLRT